jgi:hypothetical protein
MVTVPPMQHHAKGLCEEHNIVIYWGRLAGGVLKRSGTASA